MNKIELQIKGTPIIFTGDSVTYNGKEFFYHKMKGIKHLNTETPSITFIYDEEAVQIPYDPSDQAIMEQIFKEITATVRAASETPLSPSPDELTALLDDFQLPPLDPPASKVQPQQQRHDYKQDKVNTMKYDKTKLCNSCGKRIAKSAKACPYCGAKNKRPIHKRWWFIVACVLIVSIIVGSTLDNADTTSPTGSTENTSAETTKTTKPTEGVLTIAPGDLLEKYEENEVKGDEIYAEKMMKLTGVIDDIGKDIMEDVYITFKVNDEYSFTSVQCFFSDDEQIKKVMDLKPGQKITIVGRCDGKFGNVLIKDCKIE
ncbi:hypothetical protein NE619_10595 [Anaerovorax odorimutans]|uniref:Zinc-ribbon domain-containing protein n=1 Tax=Anaerovorax odorimutans TaxID=109327 RepID=A0ABT1RPP8_9FIRM|nr:hypothetical protein [Anaerovorax odorimutans]MCQ4637174.1 hypothetical protein [Anaerovorax odorimutans]